MLCLQLQPPAQQYKPKQTVKCSDPLCGALNGGGHQCSHPDEQCDYELHYADAGSSLGVLVGDYFTLKFSNGSVLHPRLAFGSVSSLLSILPIGYQV